MTSMTTTTKREIKKIAKDLGLLLSNWNASSRVSGWGNSTEGLTFSEVYPFKNRYQRDWRYHYFYSKDEAHDMSIGYTISSYKSRITDEERAEFKARADAALTAMKTALTSKGITFKDNGDTITVYVANPYFNTATPYCCGAVH